MSFVSISYALLMVGVFLLYWLVVGRSVKWQNILLLAASYVFYAWWDWRFLSLILITTFSTYLTARLAGRELAKGYRTDAKLITCVNIIINLSILLIFKYFNFFGENLGRLFELFGVGLDWVTLDVLLPVGISFYTFQAIGYSVDVYRGDVLPEKSAMNFATFLAFFPQLVAGPIERARHLMPQIAGHRTWDYALAVEGMRQILWGLAKKVILADFVGIAVNNIYDAPSSSGSSVLMAAVLFSFQIYGDFSGYSDMAIGSAKLLGIRLTRNFHYPYQAISVADFWRRWHISLMGWFRDYVYLPLGGSRKGMPATARNIAVVFLLSGLWHGASWTFVGWGAYWAVIMIVERLLRRNSKSENNTPRLKQSLSILSVFVLAAIGWILFRSPDFSTFATHISTICSTSLFAIPRGLTAFIICCAFYAIDWKGRRGEFPLANMPVPTWVRWLAYWAIFLAILWYQRLDVNQFIYFQF